MNHDDHFITRFYINLTRRQRDVARLASYGLTNEQIADALVVRPSVVAGHLTSIYAEMEMLDPGYLIVAGKRYALIGLFAGFFKRHPEFQDNETS